ncbi:MAG: peptidoglycan editing factor PgeF [Lewinellaceae bacterium]|nr:peptidoglycan editing factor PgeF [Lewinellaceae bacterium]
MDKSPLSFHRPTVFNPFPQLIAAESTRHGGISQAPYQALNLGKNTGDDPANVQKNRHIFASALDFQPQQLAWSKQVHGAEIALVRHACAVEGYDALISNTPGVVLSVSVADCTPILVYDAKNRAVAAIHAGWRGTVAGIVYKTLEAMHLEFGTMGSDCYAWVGTCIDACSYEVGDDVAGQFGAEHKQFDESRGKFCVDLKKANADQLRAFGLPEAQLEISPWSTVLHNHRYFSHRLEKGITGRMNAVIGMR